MTVTDRDGDSDWCPSRVLPIRAPTPNCSHTIFPLRHAFPKISRVSGCLFFLTTPNYYYYYEADPRKTCLRLSRFPAPLVTPAFGFSCSYGIYYMKGRHRRARFVRIEHDTQLRNFTDANCTQNIHTNTRIFRRQSGPEILKARPSVRGGGGHVRATSTVVHGAARSQTCAGADGDVSV